MRLLNLPPKAWMKPPAAGVHDVIIVGGGVSGLSAAAALRFLGISHILVLDRAPAGREGPWVTFARMRTLRTAKDVTGPALGVPSLTPRAWFEAQYGEEAWQSMARIPRDMWMEYMVWYRRVLQLPVRNDVTVTDIRPLADGTVSLESSAGGFRARRVVLATGLDGLGMAYVPAVTQGIDRRFWAHSADDIDFSALRGKRVGVVGAGASAMDNAAVALESGAASVEILIRRGVMPRVDKFTGVGSRGMAHGYLALPDAVKWALFHANNVAQLPAPRHSVLRVSAFPNARFHLGSPVLAMTQQGDALRVKTPRHEYDLDFLIFATGFAVDPARRPELGGIAPHIRLWRDRFSPAPGLEDEALGWSPDLGPGFELQERVAGACPGLGHISAFNYPAVLSHGKLTSGIPSVSEGAQRLAQGILRGLFVEDAAWLEARFDAYATPELLGDEWTDADAG